jgi:hypothetical protein
MKNKLVIIFVLSISLNTFSQSLYVTKRDYSNSSNYVHTLQKLNSLDGTVLNNNTFSTFFPNSYSPRSLTFNSQSNEIFGISGNIITKKNCITNNEISFTLPAITSINYQGLVIADNRLFLTKNDNTVISETNYIEELNQSNGEVISSHILTSNIPYYNSNLTYLSSTNEILGLSGNTIYRFNILNNIETSFTLPTITNVQYDDIVIAENRLFVTTRDYSVTPNVMSIIELSLFDFTIINTHNYTTNLENFSYIDSLTFLADTHEICGITKGYLKGNFYFKIVKYNIINNTETSFELPSQTSVDYDELISTITEENLSINDFNDNSNLKIIKAYNLLGQEIQLETYNQIIIAKYENGEIRKVWKKNNF